MKYFELICKAYLKKDISFANSFEIISKYITFSMSQIESLKSFHYSNNFKHYVFGGFLPIEKEKIYLQDKFYRFSIRSLNGNFIENLSELLRANIYNPFFQVLDTKTKTIRRFFVKELYSATPVITSADNNNTGIYWTMEKDGDIFKLQRLLHENLKKKYQTFYGETLEPSQNFVQLIEIKNKQPQNIKIVKNDKRITFFGNKFRIIPNEDDISQKLAFTALACGLGEKNSFGGGFCLVKGIKL